MKRYLLFEYAGYYPNGGLRDLMGHFNTLDEVREYVSGHNEPYDYVEVLDIITGKALDLQTGDEIVVLK